MAIDPGKYQHWKPNTQAEAFLPEVEKALVRQYKDLLNQLQREVSKAYAQYAQKGILSYDQMARFNAVSGLSRKLAELVDKAFTLRAKLITSSFKRGQAKAYHDILYQAEKLAYAQQMGRAGFLPIDARGESAAANQSFWNWMEGGTSGGGGPFKADLDLLAAQGKAAIPATVQQALAGEGSTFKQFVTQLTQNIQSDYGKSLRVVHTRGNQMINTAQMDAFHSDYVNQIIKAAGMEENGLTMIWMHDEPKIPRETHVALHGTAPDRDGLWWSNGFSARGPGQFAVASENSRCRCFLSMLPADQVTRVSTQGGILTIEAGSYASWRDGKAEG